MGQKVSAAVILVASVVLALGIVGYFAFGARKNLRIGEDSKV